MDVLLTREKSSMVSTWTEMIGFFQEKNGDWVLGNCRYEILGSKYDLLTEEQLYADDGFQIPEKINGVKVHGIADGEYLESEEIIFFEETVTFGRETFQKAVDYFDSYEWNSHPDYELALEKLRAEVFSAD